MLLDELKNIVGPKAWTNDEAALEPHLTEWRGAVRGRTPIMVSPANTDEVAAVVKACAAARVGIVPQGGNTGMCAGAVPDDSGTQVILSLSRLNRIRAINVQDFSLVAEAGCILASIQEAARSAGRYFPLSLGGEGSCQIGGNLATNAGGINVIRYGTARDLALGLEVVLADGAVWNGIRTVRKDTAGYDLKQLFIGSEGTLGIITAAAVKLFPNPGATTTALIALNSADDAVTLLSELRVALADRIEAFELIGSRAFELVRRHIPNTRLPFESPYDWFILVEAAVDPDQEELQNLLLQAARLGTIEDAAIAKSVQEAGQFWRMRHSISAAEKLEGASLKHDISVPTDRINAFLSSGKHRIEERIPDASLVVFGHVGDGNLHYNLHVPTGFQELATQIVYELVAELGGSISAEHGVGVLKKTALLTYKSEQDLNLMRSLKMTLDPLKILNPGKVI
jgi:FAD/FMN-containing dehydrogenase